MTTVKRKSKQLGQILIELGFISPEQLETALEEHRKTPKSLGRVLIDLGMIKEADLVRALAEQVGLEFVDLNEFPIDATSTVLLPEALSRRYRAIPIGERDGRLLVAMSDPANVYAQDDIRTITGRDVQPVVATANDVEEAIQKFSGMDSQVEAMASIAAESVDETTADLEEALEDAPIVKLVNAIMTQAVGDRASDVHLVTGPTGSGKSTTMYSTLNILNEESKNIITVEDPVEYRLAGVNQMQVNPKAGLTFAAALRSILRADPDIVLIGEIRDKETATIAIEAALTGHLVLSSLHTNDAPSAISRLVEMDVETFLVASAIDCVVGQRLARKLCERCRSPYRPDENELYAAGYPDWLWPEIQELHKPAGCPACANTGFRGRIGLYEVMQMTEEIERLTVERASADAIKAVAVQQGMMTLRDDGLEKARMGLTSLEEVARVVK